MRNLRQESTHCVLGPRHMVAILLVVLASSGCSGNTSYTVKPAREYSARVEPAKVTTETKSALLDNGYMSIGRIEKTSVTRKCTIEYENFTEWCAVHEKTPWTAHCEDIAVDSTDELLKDAASRGGDLVVLTKDKELDSRDNHGTCHWQTDDYDYWQDIPSGKTSFSLSSGTIWRYEPELGRSQRFDEAIVNGRIDVLRGLIADVVDFNSEYCSRDHCLRRAVNRAHPEIVRALIENGAKVKIGHLIQAAQGFGQDAPGTVRILLEKIPDVNVRDKKGQIALYVAIESVERDIVKLLLDAGADPNIPGEIPGFAERLILRAEPVMPLRAALRLGPFYGSMATEKTKLAEDIVVLLRVAGASAYPPAKNK